jgi:hypothetical protein
MNVNQLRCLPLLIPICLCGCATSALWQNDYLEHFNQPASNPNLRLHAAPKESDVLVTYDEYCERRDRVRTRAYWLNRNEQRIAQRQAPHFEHPKRARGLQSIPVFEAEPHDVERLPLYAVCMNSRSFMLVFKNGPTSDYMLPFYNDGTGRLRKVFFTPAAVAADATLVGGCIGLMYLQSGPRSTEWHR